MTCTTTEPRSGMIRHTLARSLFVCALAFAAHPVLAYSGEATDAAFAALLAMPGAEPETGSWDFPRLEDFEADSEASLIRYLARMKKTGADFNAYRHQGTLLHHAIRAGKTKAAIWLLKNGARPEKPLRDGSDNALDLAVQYKRSTLIQLLQQKPYGLKRPVLHAPVQQASTEAAGRKLSYTSNKDLAPVRAYLSSLAWKGRYEYKPALVEEWKAFVSRLPAGANAKIMDDAYAMQSVTELFRLAPDGLEAVFDGLPKATIQRHAQTIADALAEHAYINYSSDTPTRISYTIPANNWRALWKRLDAPLNYDKAQNLAGDIQPELWPALFASGYHQHNAETPLGCLLSGMDSASFKTLWPSLEEFFTDIRENAPGMVLASYRLSTVNRPCYHTASPQDTAAKLQFLLSVGVRSPVTGLAMSRLKDALPELLTEIQAFTPKSTPTPRLVDATPDCRFSLNDIWYQELLKSIASSTEVNGQTVQLFEIPGQRECGLLIFDDRRDSHYPDGIIDSFTGPIFERLPSAADPVDQFQVWVLEGGQIRQREVGLEAEGNAPEIFPVLDTVTKKRYYLNSGFYARSGYQYWALPRILEWTNTPKGLALMPSHDADVLEKALREQCEQREEGVWLRCRGLVALTKFHADEAYSEPTQEPTLQDAYKPMAIQTFIDIQRKEQRLAYLAAIQSLDKQALKDMQSKGIPATWTAEAIKQIGTSQLSTAEKRQRTAWIFRDRKQLSLAVDSDVLKSLLPWLPREDWRPLFPILSSYSDDYFDLNGLRKHAEKLGYSDLACDLDHVRGLLCGETIHP